MQNPSKMPISLKNDISIVILSEENSSYPVLAKDKNGTSIYAELMFIPRQSRMRNDLSIFRRRRPTD